MARIRSIPECDWKLDKDPWGQERSFVYLITEEGGLPTKIGVAGHPVRRLSSLQCGNSRRLILVAVYECGRETAIRLERAVMFYFNEKMILGEWIDERSSVIERFIDSFGAT